MLFVCKVDASVSIVTYRHTTLFVLTHFYLYDCKVFFHLDFARTFLLKSLTEPKYSQKADIYINILGTTFESELTIDRTFFNYHARDGVKTHINKSIYQESINYSLVKRKLHSSFPKKRHTRHIYISVRYVFKGRTAKM